LNFFTQTQENQASISAQNALDMFKEGNKRFIEASPIEINYANQIELTKSGQYPFAVVLSCIDSRVPSEIIFDQGIGDLLTLELQETA
jgi:carbonic anhydrase